IAPATWPGFRPRPPTAIERVPVGPASLDDRDVRGYDVAINGFRSIESFGTRPFSRGGRGGVRTCAAHTPGRTRWDGETGRPSGRLRSGVVKAGALRSIPSDPRSWRSRRRHLGASLA